MNDKDFCQAMGYDGGIKRELAENIRVITGELCNVRPGAITPSEDTERLNSSTPDGWDELEFLMRLESIYGFPLEGIQLPNFTVRRFFFLHKRAKPLNYGEWVKSVVEMLAPIITVRVGKEGIK